MCSHCKNCFVVRVSIQNYLICKNVLYVFYSCISQFLIKKFFKTEMIFLSFKKEQRRHFFHCFLITTVSRRRSKGNLLLLQIQDTGLYLSVNPVQSGSILEFRRVHKSTKIQILKKKTILSLDTIKCFIICLDIFVCKK